MQTRAAPTPTPGGAATPLPETFSDRSPGDVMTGGFYIDADDQRQKARWAEQRLLEHSESRQPCPPSRRSATEEDDPVAASLPPVFRREGQYQTARDTSIERRAARFRDGLPPPPPPEPLGDGVPRMLRPASPPLLDQRLLDRGVAIPVEPVSSAQPVQSMPPMIALPQADQAYREDESEPQYRMTPQGLVPVVNTAAAPPLVPTKDLTWGNAFIDPNQLVIVLPDIDAASLSPSQKKRLRRKKKKLSTGASRPAPYPLQIDQSRPVVSAPPPATNGAVHPSHSEIRQTACDAEVLVQMPDGSVHRVRCPLTPFPHPNQPHLVQLRSAQGDGAEIFLGFWMAGE
jgi:hypothetical protein